MHIIPRLRPDWKWEEVPRCWGSPLSGAACRRRALCSAECRRLKEQLRWLRNTTLGPESGMLTESGSPRFCNLIPSSAGSRSYGFAGEGRSLCQREFKSLSSSVIGTARDLNCHDSISKSFSVCWFLCLAMARRYYPAMHSFAVTTVWKQWNGCTVSLYLTFPLNVFV